MNQIVAVTGTKGKTGLVRLLEHVFRQQGENVLRVDTSGAYYNQKIHYSDEDSRSIWGYAATNAPGRFLALHDGREGISLLECTLFSARTGLAYKAHDVGVFTNVFEDHIGSFPDIQTKQDIAQMKSFVFSHIRPGGSAVYNADDEFVRGQLVKVPAKVAKIAVSTKTQTPSSEADYWVCNHDDQIVLYEKSGQALHSIPIANLKWLEKQHVPSMYLALFAVATIFATEKGEDFTRAVNLLASYEFDIDGGRMVKVTLQNGATAILDYAHEKVSLIEIASYARSLCKPGGKVIGVLRLAPSRTPELVRDTAGAIYEHFDEYVVYDKVDGHLRKPKNVKGYSKKQEIVGQMAHLFSKALEACGDKPVHEIVREDEAIQKAINLSCNRDVIVYIVGDDSARSRQFVSKFENKEQS